MPLAKPTQEDLRKLHAEITQISNQRFLLTTGAITLFAAIMAWMIPKGAIAENPTNIAFTFEMSATFSIVIFGLYMEHFSLRRMQRTYTSYLIATKESAWEADWKKYRQQPYWSFTKSHTALFLLLNFLGCLFPFLIVTDTAVFGSANIGIVIDVVVFCITEGVMFLVGIVGAFDMEVSSIARWEEIDKQP